MKIKFFVNPISMEQKIYNTIEFAKKPLNVSIKN